MKTLRIIISGKVQGVNYRASAKQKADELRLSGTVRNLEDGRVEATVTGNPERVAEFTAWCRLGPARAQVTQCAIEELPLLPFNDFRIVYS